MSIIDQTITDAELDKLFQPTVDDFRARDRRTCDCPLTYVHRKYHSAIGTGIEIKVCCMAKAIEKHLGLPPGTFFIAMDFEPEWEWDCSSVMKKERRLPDGSVEVTDVVLGAPPEWIKKRMDKKGIEIRNLP